MAIRLADYYNGHTKRVILATIGVQVLITIALVTLLLFSGFDALIAFVYILLPVLSLQVFAFIIILRFALSPLEILTRTITHVSTQANDVTPPNLNGTYHEKTGLKAMIDTIYELAVSGPQPVADVQQTGAFASAILENLPCGIILLNAKREIVYANAAAPVVVDPKETKQIQLDFDTDDSFTDWLTQAEGHELSDGRSWHRIENVLPDQQNRKLYDVFTTYHKNGTDGIETVLVTIDRTDHYARDEEDMDFIALAAHELRGPITVIRGYLEILGGELQTTLTPDQVQLFERLDVSASRLSGYVGNILNVSRFDRRHLKLHLREDRLSDVYATIADDLQLRASTQGRLLSVTIPVDLPTIAADRNSLSEVMTNLVDNAIKYSAEGGQVAVTAAVDSNFVTCKVEDFGIGIPSSIVSNLFTKFYRSHRSRQTVAGTGLGLYISKAIIESHGGRMGLKSTEGSGSVFSFSVPIYSTVAAKLLASNNENEGIIESGNGWIKNHSMYEG